MTTIANCFNLNEALHLQMILESVGIPSFIPDETVAGVAPHHFLSGVRLQVADQHIAEAQKIVAEQRRSA